MIDVSTRYIIKITASKIHAAPLSHQALHLRPSTHENCTQNLTHKIGQRKFARVQVALLTL